MLRVKLVYIRGAEIGTRKKQSYPLGIMDIKAYAYSYSEIKEKVEIDIDVIDYDVQDEAYVYEIYSQKYNMIFFSTYIWNISRVLELCRKIKTVNRNLIVGLGGPEVDDATRIMDENDFIDIIITGEGEKPFVSLIKHYLNIIDEPLKGVVYRDIEGNIIQTGNADLIENLDEIPSVVNEKLVTESKMLLYETSRGCPFQCKYCCWAGKKMRYYSLDRVEKELKILLQRKSGDSLFLIDSELDIDIERAKKVMKIIINNNIYNKVIQGFLGLHKIDEELLQLCKKANFRFGIGIQSVNLETLQQCGRTWFNVEEFEKKLKLIGEFYDLKEIEFQLIMGLPGDDFYSFRNNLKWCDRMGAVNITANRLYVLPGSFFYQNPEKFGLVYDKKPYHLVYSNYSFSYDEIMKSEALLVAYQITKFIFGGHQEIKVNNKNIKIWDFIDSLVEIVEQTKCYSQGRQESQATEWEYAYERLLINNIKKMDCFEKEFVALIKMRFIQRDAHVFFADDNICKESNDFIRINKYFIAPNVSLDNSGQIILNNQYIILYLHNFMNNKIKTIKIKTAFWGEFEKILNCFVSGVDFHDIENYEGSCYGKNFIDTMIREKLCYFTNDERWEAGNEKF